MEVGDLVKTRNTRSARTAYLIVKVESTGWTGVKGTTVMVTAVNVKTGAYQSFPSQCYEVISEGG